MAIVRLGKNHLRWCDPCDFPILEEKICPVCGGETHEVDVTPPGDVRPAFDHDLDLVRRLADSQFGEGSGNALIPPGRAAVLNKAPSIDRMDEIICEGKTLANIRYDMGRGWVLVNRMQSAMRIAPVATKGYVICADSAVPFVQDSKNLMAPGVDDAHPDIVPGDEVIIMTKDRKAVATGAARMTAREMIDSERGLAVKTKWVKPEEKIPDGVNRTWEEIAVANRGVIERRRDEAVGFIRKTIEANDLPAIVSFSGGKDSLATLLLTLDAGYRLPVLFVDTGLEFTETVDHVKDVTERHGLKLIAERPSDDAFFGNLVFFGPPAKDFRWCCKTNKLGPTVKAINTNFPNGVLSFIGQRRYESEARKSKPRVWRNPWTPGQLGASPIQNWNALHVWLYIFYKKEPFNIWYTRGLDRIGCFLCPASDVAEAEAVAGASDRYAQWDEYLEDYRESRELPPEWKEYQLWRWKNVPQSVREYVANVSGKEVSQLTKQTVKAERGPLTLRMQEGYSPCTIGYSVEGALSRPVDLERLWGFAHVLGSMVELDPDGEWLTADYITVFREGSIMSKAAVEKDARSNMEKMFELIIHSEQCVGCSLCVARCREGALRMVNGKVEIEPDLCIRCRDCLGPCPAVNFRADAEEEL